LTSVGHDTSQKEGVLPEVRILLDVARVAVGALALSILAPVVQAQDRLFAGYAIDWEGLHIGAFEAILERAPGRYQLSYEARAEGMIGWLFPFVSHGSSEGARSAAQIMPERYQVGSRGRDYDRSWAVAFDGDGRAVVAAVPEDELLDREPVPDALQVAPDPLALMLDAITQAAPGVRSTGNSFDGKRALRFALDCAPAMVALTDVPAGAAAAAEHDALACTVDGELVGGASRRWRGRTMRDGEREPATVWLRGGILDGSLWPVRVVAETRYGTVTAHLVQLERVDPPPS
jgi:hypothetical protein